MIVILALIAGIWMFQHRDTWPMSAIGSALGQTSSTSAGLNPSVATTEPGSPSATATKGASTTTASSSSGADTYHLTTTGPGKGTTSTKATAVLGTLPVKGKAPMTGYDRTKQFGPAWTDNTSDPLAHNGCDTRNDILQRDMVGEVFRKDDPDCIVATGILSDPYTGKVIHFTRGVGTSTDVQIDHVVALGNVWESGGQQLSQEQRVDAANDPLNLLAVDGPANMAKGKSNAAEWLPPNKAYRCAYVARQIAVKAKYDLSVTKAEKTAMQRVLTKCPNETIPAE